MLNLHKKVWIIFHTASTKRNPSAALSAAGQNIHAPFTKLLKYSSTREQKMIVFLIRVSHRDRVLELKDRGLARQLNVV